MRVTSVEAMDSGDCLLRGSGVHRCGARVRHECLREWPRRRESRGGRWCRADGGFRRDLAAVLLHDAVADGEAEAGALVLAGLRGWSWW